LQLVLNVAIKLLVDYSEIRMVNNFEPISTYALYFSQTAYISNATVEIVGLLNYIAGVVQLRIMTNVTSYTKRHKLLSRFS
jgi:hypothetical protein